MLLGVVILGLGSFLASGILFRHQRVLTLLAAAGGIGQAWHLLLTLARRLVWPEADPGRVFLFGAIIFLVLWLPCLKRWRWPYTSIGSGWRDLVVLVALAPVLASSWFIQQANGLHDGEWVAHGFYNGDTGSLIALVQRSLTTNGLVEENLFAANGHLEYPSLIHADVAEYILQFGQAYDWLSFLPLIVWVQILITVPLFFLVRDLVKDVSVGREGYRWRWRGILLEGAAVGYVLGVSWESYVYPQAHFFVMAGFLLLLALLVRLWPERGQHQLLWAGAGFVLTILLLLSNAVTGVAALATWAMFSGLRFLDSSRGSGERTLYAVSLGLLLILFARYMPGDGGIQFIPQFPYTAAPGMLLFATPLLLVLGAAVQQLRRQSFVGLTTIVLAALALVTFFFSDRDLIIDNASRFFYHALIVGWPLAVDSLIRGVRILAARLRQLNSPSLLVGGVAAACIVLIILLLPVGASVASVHDHLLFKNEHRSHVGIRLGMEWIAANTPLDAVFLASPHEPWEVPLFTGRALVRADYWLSPHDELEKTVIDAFAGNQEAQKVAATQVDYIVLKSEEQPQWNIPESARIYNFGGVAIYDAKKWQ